MLLVSKRADQIKLKKTLFVFADPTEQPKRNAVSSGSKDPWKLRYKYITTSVQRINVRPQGVTYNVGYVDTGADWHYSQRNSANTILAIHGLPSQHTDMLPIVQPFHEQGCRVIAVNLPGYNHSLPVSPDDERFFHQSTVEITEFLLNFLRTLKVKSVEVLVAHSAGSLPATVLSGSSDVIKSFMTICPYPGHTPPKGEIQQKCLRLLFKIHDSPLFLGRMLIRFLIPSINRLVTRFAESDPTRLVNVYRNMTNMDFKLLQSLAMELEMKQLPLVFAYSSNDSFMPRKHSEEWAERYGLLEHNFDEYDMHFQLVKSAELSGDSYRKGIVFHRGGHYPQFKKDTALPILVKEISRMLEITSKPKGDS